MKRNEPDRCDQTFTDSLWQVKSDWVARQQELCWIRYPLLMNSLSYKNSGACSFVPMNAFTESTALSISPLVYSDASIAVCLILGGTFLTYSDASAADYEILC